MKLKTLTLRNFKGILEFTIEPKGSNVDIYGDNGVGKTTIFDGFSWLLFNKDSTNKSDFEIKTLWEDGQPMHGLEHEVEATLEIEGKELTLRKVYSENWTKQRGSATKQFTGHSTNYFIDGVPVKQTEYQARIASIVDENAFRLLTNPRQFNEVLHWQERRKLLLKVCGDISDADVIGTDSKLAKLPEILGDHSLDDYRKIIASKRVEINKEIEKIPVRISEVQRGLPDTSELNTIDNVRNYSLDTLREQRAKKNQELTRLESGGEVAEQRRQLAEIETEITKIEREQWTKSANETQVAKTKLREFAEQKELLASTRLSKERYLADICSRNVKLEARMKTLREDFAMVNAECLTLQQFDVCPVCGQNIPESQLEDARAKAEAVFNLNKSKDLLSINNEGKEAKEAAEKLKSEIADTEKEITELDSKYMESTKQYQEAKEVVDGLEKKEKEFIIPADLIQRQTDITTKINELNVGGSEAIGTVRIAIQHIDEQIAEEEQVIAQGKQREDGLKRIEELKSEERNLAEEFERLEANLYLTEQFVRTKVSMLEENINSKFTRVKFKLFNQLVNGGIEECCITLIDGVPYPNLNHGGEMAAGLDIISTLQSHYGFECPVWIDNAEAFCHLPAMQNQMIKLIVSEPDKVLRVETTESSEKVETEEEGG